MLPINTLVIVLFLLQFEYMLNKKLLEILISIINAELFEAIVIEILKTEDIQYTYSTTRIIFRSVYGLVNFLYNVYK